MEFNPLEVTIFLRCTLPGNNADRSAHIFELTDSASDNRILLSAEANSNEIDALLIGAEGTMASATFDASGLQRQVANMALAYSAAGVSIAINGAVVTATANTRPLPVGIVELNLGVKSNGSNHVVASVYEDFKIFPVRKTDAELITLTGG